MTVTVKKIGGSVGVLIPRSLAKELELKEGTNLSISGSADAIVLRREGRRPRRSLRSIVAKIKPESYRRRKKEMTGDGPVGREVW